MKFRKLIKIRVCIFWIALVLASTANGTRSQGRSCNNIHAHTNANAVALSERPLDRPSFRQVGNAQVMKFTLVLNRSGRLKQLVLHDTANYGEHADYLRARIPALSRLELVEIDRLAVENKGLIYGSLVLRSNGRLEFDFTTPEISPESVTGLWAEFVDKLESQLRPHLPELAGRVQSLSWARSSQLRRQNEDIAVVQPGEATGTLVLVSQRTYRSQLERGEIGPDTVVVLDWVPDDFVPVAGLILPNRVSALSHLAMQAASFGTPVAAGPAVIGRAQALANRRVHLRVNEGGSINLTDQLPAADLQNGQDTVTASLALLRGVRPANGNIRARPVAIEEISAIENLAHGAKAANLGSARRLLGNRVLPGVSIPLRYQDRLFAGAKTSKGEDLPDFIERRLDAISRTGTPTADILRSLGEIRREILGSQLNSRALREIENAIRSQFETHQPLIFRSSSNAEDLPGFNGAGLHESIDGNLATVEASVRRVLASLYSDRAHLARARRGIRQVDARMGLLVQPKIEDLATNGVMIFDPITRRVQIDYYPGALSAVRTHGRQQPLRIELEVSLQGEVSMPDGLRLITPAELRGLVDSAHRLAEAWPIDRQGSLGVPLDLEWGVENTVDGRRLLRVFQVREAPRTSRSTSDRLGTRFEVQTPGHSPKVNHGAIPAERLLLMIRGEGARILRQALALPIEIDWRASLVGKEKLKLNRFVLHGRSGETLDLSGLELPIRNVRERYFNATHATVQVRHQITWAGMQLTLQLKEYVDADLPRDQAIQRLATGSHVDLVQSMGGSREDYSTMDWTYSRRENLMEHYRLPSNRSEGEVSEIEIPGTSVRIRMGAKGRWSENGTSRELPQSLEVIGLTSEPLVLDPVRAYVDMPEHHNRGGTTLIDLHQTQNPLTATQRAELAARGAPRFVVSRFSRASDFRITLETADYLNW